MTNGQTESFAVDPEKRELGLQKMEEVYGFSMSDGPGTHFRYTVEHLFGDIWQRPGLTVRDRRLLLLGALTAQGGFDLAEIQLGAAMQNGELDEEQMREIAVFLCHYVGWPNGTKLDNAVGSVVRKANKK
ncbi:carboxymuconolactone decarboxylase family protein [Aldersonia kunmingensis]|uniref:carboxymuconolactone decarboxylase family protein n=1 Tax=Aldersonia kunmingensis TaxID=408066 RepID=UPI00082A5238|nr:carboxymuconolactone decarboxylase family protein [Aldersonia kunmingensis]